SSRRRHTRFSRDWSSDVCSSDLGGDATPPPAPAQGDWELLSGGGGDDTAPATRVELDLGALATSDLLVVDGVLPAEALITGARAVGVPVAVGLGRTSAPPTLEQQPYLAADLLCLRVGPDVDELELLATWRQRSAARLVVLTLGERGALGATADSTEVIHVPA